MRNGWRGWQLAARFSTYAGVGAIGTAAQYGVLIAAVNVAGTGPVAGSTAGALTGAIVNYLLNRRFTFRSSAKHSSTLPRFAMAACAGIVVNGLAMKAMTAAGLHYLVAQVIATALVLALTFTINSMWTFRQQHRAGDTPG